MAQQKDDDNDMIVIALAATLGLVGLMFALQYFNAEINYWFARFKIYETWPYMWWNDSWSRLTSDILDGKRDLGAASTGAIAAFYNRWASFVWLPLFGWLMWKVWKQPTRKQWKHEYNMQTLLAASSKICSSVVPWINRDITKKSWNLGTWRLMDSPLSFLIRNRAILDENGEPFRWNQVYNCGDTDILYDRKSDGGGQIGIMDEGYRSFASVMSGKKKEKKKFELPDVPVGTPQDEIKKFMASELVPLGDSPYLNKKKQERLNSIDERRLATVLSRQLGERMDKDPFEWHRNLAKRDPSQKWRYGLLVALYLHGMSINTKDDANKIIDAMNWSFLEAPGFDEKKLVGGDGFDPLKIDISLAEKLSKEIKWQECREFQEMVMNRHSRFANTFWMALLGFAKTKGVISESAFGWVKAFDRTLWYSFNQMGRSVCSPEAAGVWSHYWAEEAVGPLDTPYVAMAIEGFREEMINEGWLNEDLETRKRKESSGSQDAGVANAAEMEKSGMKPAEASGTESSGRPLGGRPGTGRSYQGRRRGEERR